MVVLSGRLRRWRSVLTSQCCNLGRGRTKGAVPAIIRKLGEAGSHIVPLRALSVGDAGAKRRPILFLKEAALSLTPLCFLAVRSSLDLF